MGNNSVVEVRTSRRDGEVSCQDLWRIQRSTEGLVPPRTLLTQNGPCYPLDSKCLDFHHASNPRGGCCSSTDLPMSIFIRSVA